jgi:heat shock protein HtpX
MWELIRRNKRKSIILFIMMGVAWLLLGYLVGWYYWPGDGGFYGLMAAIVIWLALSIFSYFGGDNIMLSMTGAMPVTPEVNPRLFNVVEEMKIAGSLPVIPKIYIIDSPAMNAFAVGREPDKAAVAVTVGLLAKLNRDELQGVIAHEISHIKNRDSLFMVFAGILLGSIVLLSEVFLRGLWYTGGGSSRRFSSGRSSRSGGGGGGWIAILAIVFAILAPLIAQLLYFAISRKREYLADASAARLTRYPEGLASALEKISNSPEGLSVTNKAAAPLFIINPLKKPGESLHELTSTHPPTYDRIRILRSMAGGASLMNYQMAYIKVKGKKQALIPPSGLAETVNVPVREPSVDQEPVLQDNKRDLGDLIRAANHFIFLTCLCGLKLKIPPDFKKPSFPCPRCKRELTVPVAELAMLSGIATAASQAAQPEAAAEGQPEENLVYHRKGGGYESFKCTCGRPVQLSPAFEGTHVRCNNCKKKIAIES